MAQEAKTGLSWPILLVGGIVVVAAAAVAIQTVPELAPLRRFTREAEDLAVHLPERARSLRDDVRRRLETARAAFRSARSESERVLIAQFEEAKQRGSVPPD